MSDVVDFKHPPKGPPKEFPGVAEFHRATQLLAVCSRERGLTKNPRSPGAPTLKDKFGEMDAYHLKWCAEWRAARAQMQKNWALHDLAAGWGTLSDVGIKLDSDPLERMKELEWHLAEVKPQTMLLARELLRMAVTILAYTGENPDCTLGNGPVLEIVRNVLASLEHCKAEMRIGPKHPEA